MRRSQGDEQLTAYVLGELAPADAAEVEARLLVDEEAAAEVESLRATVGMLGEALGAEELPVLGEERRQLILAGPGLMRIEGGRGWRLKVAAALLIGLGGVVVTRHMLRESETLPGAGRVAQKDVRAAEVVAVRAMPAREPGRGAFMFVGEPAPAVAENTVDLIGAGPVMLSLHTVSMVAGDVRMASVPRLLDDIEVRTPLREQLKAVDSDGPVGGDGMNTNVFRF
jgi:hypothetical protein